MSLPLSGVSFRERLPTVDEYQELRRVAGLSAFSREAAEAGLPRSLLAVVAEEATGHAVGMARGVGDGGCFVQIVDVAVHPEHQGKGVGKGLMRELMSRLEERLPERCYVSLLADGQAHRLYAQYGFVATAPASIGMARRIESRKVPHRG